MLCSAGAMREVQRSMITRWLIALFSMFVCLRSPAVSASLWLLSLCCTRAVAASHKSPTLRLAPHFSLCKARIQS